MTEQTDPIVRLRKQAQDDRQQINQRVSGSCYQTDLSGSNTGIHHKTLHFSLVCICIVSLFFAVDYLDTKHDYVSAISKNISKNEQIRSTYEQIENSAFIEWVTALVSQYIE